MKNYSAVVFDLDGTLADTSPGIMESYNYAMESMGVQTDSQVPVAIGAPLGETLEKLFGDDGEKITRTTAIYRKHYSEFGLYNAQLYQGMLPLLKELRALGYKLGVATLKLEAAAKKQLEYLEIAGYFDAILGMDSGNSRTKAQLIRQCMQDIGTEPTHTVMVGDSDFDAEGAKAEGVDFAAAAYGLGFGSVDEALKWAPAVILESPGQLFTYLEGKNLESTVS